MHGEHDRPLSLPTRLSGRPLVPAPAPGVLPPKSGPILLAGWILSAPIESCRVQWCGEEHGAPTPAPEAIHVRTAAGRVWIAAGRSATYEPDGPLYLGTDDVLVIVDTDVAERAGIRV